MLWESKDQQNMPTPSRCLHSRNEGDGNVIKLHYGYCSRAANILKFIILYIYNKFYDT
jgi:hypothetical protein